MLLLDIVKSFIPGLGLVLALRAGWLAILLWRDYMHKELGPWASMFFLSVTSGAVWSLAVANLIEFPQWATMWRFGTLLLAVISLDFFYHELREEPGKTDE